MTSFPASWMVIMDRKAARAAQQFVEYDTWPLVPCAATSATFAISKGRFRALFGLSRWV